VPLKNVVKVTKTAAVPKPLVLSFSKAAGTTPTASTSRSTSTSSSSTPPSGHSTLAQSPVNPSSPTSSTFPSQSRSCGTVTPGIDARMAPMKADVVQEPLKLRKANDDPPPHPAGVIPSSSAVSADQGNMTLAEDGFRWS
jgi:hypothetical protein